MQKLYIDIGHKTTKILEVSVSRSKLRILRLAEMRDMSDYITQYGGIKAVEGFCLSLKKTLEDAGMVARVAHICTSILGIQHANITDDFDGIRDCRRRFSRKYGVGSHSPMACDWQYFGDVYKNARVKQQLRMAVCPARSLSDFIKCIQNTTGIRVISVESTFSSAAHLAALHRYDFVVPSTCIADATSNSIDLQFYKNGGLVSVSHVGTVLTQLSKQVAQQCDVTEYTAASALYRIGMGYGDSQAASKLASMGIQYSFYLRSIEAAINDFCSQLTKEVTTVSAKFALEEAHLVLSGGIFAVAGLKDLVARKLQSTSCTFAEIRDVISVDGVVIDNISGRHVTSEFSSCLGMMLRKMHIHPLNLCAMLKHYRRAR